MIRTLLVADDEPSVLETTRFVLEAEGYRVLAARNGEDALTLARRERPRVLLLDVHMPRLSGLDVCRTLRREFPQEAMVILILTARGQDEDEKAALLAGADAFIRKPFDETDLLMRLTQAFGGEGMNERRGTNDRRERSSDLSETKVNRHDRDNVLSGLLGAVRILEKGMAGPLTDDQAAFVAIIRDCAEKLSRMA